MVRPSREQAEQAVKTLIAWAGDDPERPGLLKTPSRVVDAYKELFSGYDQDISCLNITYEEGIGDYNDLLLVRDIMVESHCEHHMVSMHGVAHVAYVPNGQVVGLSKLARVVDVFARRLQVQEVLTLQIAQALYDALAPLGVAVMMTLRHDCMCRRGVRKSGALTTSTHMLGCFQDDPAFSDRFYQLVGMKA